MAFWSEFCRCNRAVLEIAITRQSVMRDKVLGHSRWESITATRTALTGGRFMKVKDMFEMIACLTEKGSKRRRHYNSVFGLDSEEPPLKLKRKPTSRSGNVELGGGVSKPTGPLGVRGGASPPCWP